MARSSQDIFPSLELSAWEPTRDTIHGYAQLLGKIREAFTPRYRHWSNVSLRVSTSGLTTNPIAIFDQNKSLEVEMDFIHHRMAARTSTGEEWHTEMDGRPLKQMCSDLLDALSGFGIEPGIAKSIFSNEAQTPYDREAVNAYWQALNLIHLTFKAFKGPLRKETSQVQLWPHHFDLAFLWFSGRLVPGQDPDDDDYADEQMNFGFVTGDDSIREPYFYITAYPVPDGLPLARFPAGVSWVAEDFNGAVLKYKDLLETDDPKSFLTEFLKTVHDAGSKRMLKA